MFNFEFGLDTKIAFGAGQVKKLAEVIQAYGKNVLIVCGGGSAKKNGAYDDVVRVVKGFGGCVTELSGIPSNPTVSKAREGVTICKEKGIDAIVAIGGGSVIDCSKLIAAGAKYNGDCWELVKNPILIQDAVPVFVVSTVAASGSDIDFAGVIKNEETKEKEVFGSPYCSPKYTILDPNYTKSVPKRYTAAGVADMMMHILESYLHREGDSALCNRMMEAVLKIIVENGEKVMKNPESYEARANLMWAASLATSGIVNFGLSSEGPGGGAAPIHWIEGQICGFYNTIHGEVLAQVVIPWMEYILCDKNGVQFAELATNVFGVPQSDDIEALAKEGISRLKKFFFETMEIPEKMSSVGVTEEYLPECAKRAAGCPLYGGNVDLTEEDVMNILKKAL